MSDSTADTEPGLLTLVSTPIGNLADMTHRAVLVLREADLVLAEDTRHSRRLLSHYSIDTPMQSYHDHNKEKVTPGLVERLVGGEHFALISDAGTPGISDPGFYLVRESLARGVRVSAAPGANAAIMALVMTGFPTDRFAFEGFTPKKKSELVRTVESLRDERRTVIYYVAPHQLLKVLAVFAEVLPERELAVARELTKIHEEVRRGTGAELHSHYEQRTVKGEIVLVVKAKGRR